MNALPSRGGLTLASAHTARARCHPSPVSRRQPRERKPKLYECIDDMHVHRRRMTRVNTKSWLIHAGAQVRSFLHSVLPVRSFMPEPHALTGSSPRPSRERLPPPPPPPPSPPRRAWIRSLFPPLVRPFVRRRRRRRRRDVDVTLDEETSRHFPRMTAVLAWPSFNGARIVGRTTMTFAPARRAGNNYDTAFDKSRLGEGFEIVNLFSSFVVSR